MPELTKSQKARIAIRVIKTTADALALRGFYKPSGKSGQTLAEGLKMLNPEIYGSMNDPRKIELKGLEYVIERLPEGIERSNRIVLTAHEDFDHTSFEKIIPPKRRRTCYRVGEKEICFVITRGLSEIYDILTHITFLNNEAAKLYQQMNDSKGNLNSQWEELEKIIQKDLKLEGDELDKALWELSIILGRTFNETRETFEYLEEYNPDSDDINVLFNIIYHLGKRVAEEQISKDNDLLISFTPSLRDMIGNQSHSVEWSYALKKRFMELGFRDRPIHIISANMHSVLNLFYGYQADGAKKKNGDIYDFITDLVSREVDAKQIAEKHGFYEVPDISGTHIDCQMIDTAKFGDLKFHPDLSLNIPDKDKEKPVILVIDYAFGAQAFEAMDELLDVYHINGKEIKFNFKSVSVMGKAGTLPGKKGDIMLATAHVFEGTSDNYIVDNDLKEDDFDGSIPVHVGPILTVIGTSLQNKDVLNRFLESHWRAVGLEMEGGHYQKAISSAIIRRHVSKRIKTRYAYYASDNPLQVDQTLAAGSMGEEGIKPTYMITKVILEKILN